MELSKDAMRYLKKASLPASFAPDKYQTEFNNIIKDFKDVEKPDVGLLGIPFDTTSIWSARKGSSGAPAEVRRMFQYLGSYEPQLDVDISKGINIVDFGDVDVVHTNVEETYKRIEAVTKEIFDAGVSLVVIGGDHGNTFATVKALCESMNGKGRVGLINVDSHPDVRESHHGELSSGTQFRRLITEINNNILPGNFVEIGIRGWENNTANQKFLTDNKIRYITANEVKERGIRDVMKEAVEIITDGTEAAYLSMDVDGLDICYAPGTAAPTPGGLSSWDYLNIVYDFGIQKIARGMDIMEISPLLDPTGITSITGAFLVAQFFGAVKKRMQIHS
ncbi:MAG: agmatinase family protein [Thermoplasmatales archaeon]